MNSRIMRSHTVLVMFVMLWLTVSWVTTGFSADGQTWVSLGPKASDMALKSDPECVVWRPDKTDRVHCFAVGPNGQLLQKAWWNGTWQIWQDHGHLQGKSLYDEEQPNGLAKGTGKTISCVAKANELHCFARTAGIVGQLVHIGWGDGTGQSWENLRGSPLVGNGIGRPHCLNWGSQLHCYVNEEEQRLSVKWWDGAWHSMIFPGVLAGTMLNIPSCVVWGPDQHDQLHCFTIDTIHDRKLSHKGWWEGAWHDWQDLGEPSGPGGELVSDPDCLAWGLTKANQLHCFVIDDDGQLQHKGWWDGGWHAWQNLKAPSNVKLKGTPECVGWGKELHCFVKGSDGNLYRRGWVDGAWQLTWQSLGKPHKGLEET